ncbi:MAG: glycosyltransferase family 2 protein [Bacteroidota bacterium]
MANPYFSIILPTYNRAQLIAGAVESVVRQDFENWELIVVDDGSTDDTRARLAAFTEHDDRIRYMYQENAERSTARNNGIAQARGTYICFLDSDDYYLDNYLSSFKAFITALKEPVAMFFCNISFQHGAEIRKFKTPEFANYNATEFFLLNGIGTPRVCLHRSITATYLFDPSISIGEDTELWIRIAGAYPYHYLNKYLYVAVEHSGRSVSRMNAGAAIRNLKTKKHLLRHLGRQHISQSVRKTILHNAWFSLAQSYYEKQAFWGVFHASANSCVYQPAKRWKEKLYMLYAILKNKFFVAR